MNKTYKLISPEGIIMFETDKDKLMYGFMLFFMESAPKNFIDMNFYVEGKLTPKTIFIERMKNESKI